MVGRVTNTIIITDKVIFLHILYGSLVFMYKSQPAAMKNITEITISRKMIKTARPISIKAGVVLTLFW